MPWYGRVHAAIQTALPFLLPTQVANLALLVSAILAKRPLCLSELARAYPTPDADRRRAILATGPEAMALAGSRSGEGPTSPRYRLWDGTTSRVPSRLTEVARHQARRMRPG